VREGLECVRALCWWVLEYRGNEVDGIGGRAAPKNFVPRMRADLGKLELGVVRIHSSNLLAGWCSQHLDDLNQLVNSTLPWEEWLAEKHLRRHTPRAPNINRGGIFCSTKYQLRGTVVPRTDI
jgi:hypothetical protein